MSFKVPERYRIRTGPLASTSAEGNKGAFKIKLRTGVANVVASDGLGWEHVSVSFKDHCPRWDDMCEIKALFWGAEDCVIQYHPPKSAHRDVHPYCLHLWRPKSQEIPMPAVMGLAAAAERSNRAHG